MKKSVNQDMSEERQSLRNLKSEIDFREKLARQHVAGEMVIRGYMDKCMHDKIMIERVASTIERMKSLQEGGVGLSPFIELGAERGQRSLVLANDFKARGFAVDISFDQLKTLDYWSQFFHKPVLPVRVCCNAYHLPFRRNVFRFAFCYQFLHHFPAVEPVIREIYRVLADGYFYFAEEPYKRFSLNLYGRKISNQSGKLKRFLRFLESFIARQYEVEEQYGIIENDDIALDEWVRLLDLFAEKRAYLESASLIRGELGKISAFKKRLHKILGGVVSALARKQWSEKPYEERSGVNEGNSQEKDMIRFLACPVCLETGLEQETEDSGLEKYSDYLACRQCRVIYPIVEGIMILLPPEEMKQLYPQFVRRNR